MQPEPARSDFRLSGARSTRDLIAFAVIAAGVLAWSRWMDESLDNRDVMIVGGGVLILLGLWNWRAARLRARAAVDRAPRLSIGDDGVDMPDLFAERVPWTAVRKMSVFTTRGGGAYAAFHVVEPERYGFRPGPLARIENALGLGLRVNLSRLDGDADAVRAALRRHAPAALIRDL
ncbi:MAG: hypothetical protein JNK46_07345 [Methylobacteriaceae bacterium]|nr:hypothetical protein [Methylobacteriaceae bacterium]